MAKGFTTEQEIKIVALIARGDTAAQINEYMQREMGVIVSPKAVRNIRKRNQDNVDMLRRKIMVMEERNALSIKQKANRIIDKRLDSIEVDDEARRTLSNQLANGEISFKEWEIGIRKLKEMNTQQLVSISKEMHLQSIKDPDDAPTAMRKDLSALAEAIKNGDQVVLSQLIVNKGMNDDNNLTTQHAPVQDTPDSQEKRHQDTGSV